jgi:hypothetical protein
MNYTYLRYGDRLPTVGVLQKLLKRAGEKLDADGIFGPKTLAAVRHFQHAKRLHPDGIVGKHTWPRLVEGLDLPILDCVDVFDGFEKEEFSRKAGEDEMKAKKSTTSNKERKQLLGQAKEERKKAAEWTNSNEEEVDDIRAVGGKPFVIGGMSNGMEQAVSMIRSAANDAFLVRFHSHGSPGSFGIASGRANDPSAKLINPLTRVNAASKTAFRDSVSKDALHKLCLPLKNSVFGPYGTLQVMSCHTAQGVEGRDLLTEIASWVEVPVTAGTGEQLAGGPDTFKFEGPTFTAIPNGQSLQAWCGALPDFN